jgi:hypothetical protein
MDTADTTNADDKWLTAGRFALLLSLLVFITFPRVVLGTQTFIFRDYGLFSYPVAYFQRQCFWRGELALWNPYSQCGVPFLAQWNTMCLYPPALLYLLLPLTWALSFFCLAHLVWGGLGMYLLARQWTGDRLAGAVAGVIFAFNGLNLNFLMWPSHVATFSWLPWLLWLAPAGWQDGGRKLVWATLAGTLQMLAGGPETILLTWVILTLLAVGDWVRRTGPRGKLVLRFGGMVVLISLICAAQLLPFLELLRHSQRDTGYGSSDWSMPAWGWANFLVPLFRTSPTPQGVYLQPGQYWTSSYYAGIGTVLLATVAVLRSRNWRVRPVAILALFALVLALGKAGFLYSAMRHGMPVMGILRYPVKFVILVLALAPLLAAFGLQSLAGMSERRGRTRWLCGAVLLVFIVVIMTSQWGAPPTVRWMTLENGLARAGFLVLILLLLALLARQDAGSALRRRSFLAMLLLVTFWVDFRTHVPTQNPTASPGAYAAGALNEQRHWKPKPVLGESRAMISPGAQADLKYHSLSAVETSYLLSRLGLLANCGLLENIPQAHGFFSLAPGEINDICSVWYVQTNRDFSPLLDLMGVSQVSAPDQTFEWVPRPSAMPLVTAGQEPILADDRTAFAALSQTNTDFRRTVFLPLEARGAIAAKGVAGARVESTVFTDQTVTAQIRSPAPCLLVVAQTCYPAWQAFVDGERTKVWRANYAFQAVEVPAGNHRVELKYQDGAFRAGVAFSGLGLLTYGFLWRKQRRRDELSNPITH